MPRNRDATNAMAEPSALPATVSARPPAMPNRYPPAICGTSPGMTNTTICSACTAMNTSGAVTPNPPIHWRSSSGRVAMVQICSRYSRMTASIAANSNG